MFRRFVVMLAGFLMCALFVLLNDEKTIDLSTAFEAPASNQSGNVGAGSIRKEDIAKRGLPTQGWTAEAASVLELWTEAGTTAGERSATFGGTIIVHVGSEKYTFSPGISMKQLGPGKWTYQASGDPRSARNTAAAFVRSLPETVRVLDGGVQIITAALMRGTDTEVSLPAWTVVSDALLSTASVSQGGRYNTGVALNLLNGLLLPPGKEFSFNGMVGPRTPERGFAVGKVLNGNSYIDEVGGGICFASTIVHQAVKRAGLTTVEHYHHSKRSPYVEPGGDATVYYGVMDYRFRNSDSPLMLEKRSAPGRLGLRLWKIVNYEMSDESIQTEPDNTWLHQTNEERIKKTKEIAEKRRGLP
ncbi:VanW family protein [Heliobacterium mobile]|uniref:VanW family protein n=1 Tax=Heliobacterium mobile TaxID=28064 RepID=UPI002E2751D1